MSGADKSKRAARLADLRRRLPGLPLSVAPGDLEHYGRDWTRFHTPDPLAVTFVRHVEEIQELVLWAASCGQPLVPSGGRTGLSGGAVAAGGELVVSLERLRAEIGFATAGRILHVEGGMVTAEVQKRAHQRGLYYPVDFASAGGSQIGGNVATNAGGIRVLRYGMTRDQVAGLTVIDGRAERLELNRALVKNATGYDLRHLMVGSEGTLGIIAGVQLALRPPPPPAGVMLLALTDIAGLMAVFAAARAQLEISAFEFFTQPCAAAVCAAQGLPPPFECAAPAYALLEFDQPAGGEAAALGLFESLVAAGQVADGVLAQSAAQAARLWRYREAISESIAPRTPYKNDIAVTIDQVPAFLAELDELVRKHYPDYEVLWYGHLGDGNLHMNVLRPANMAIPAFQALVARLSELVYEMVGRFHGSISAEHGIGLLKKDGLHFSRSAAEIAALRAIKQTFDPAGILNPGKMF